MEESIFSCEVHLLCFFFFVASPVPRPMFPSRRRAVAPPHTAKRLRCARPSRLARERVRAADERRTQDEDKDVKLHHPHRKNRGNQSQGERNHRRRRRATTRKRTGSPSRQGKRRRNQRRDERRARRRRLTKKKNIYTSMKLKS